MKKMILKTALLATMATLTGAAQAALFDRGGGLIYDDTFDITWLADMNYARTSGYDDDGGMIWLEAVSWADNLVYGVYSDWRLPTLNPSDTSCSDGFGDRRYGYNCTGGELSHLFVADLGYNADASGRDTSDDTPEQIDNLALFSNVQSYTYWSGLELAGTFNVRVFNTDNGFQGIFYRGNEGYALAVRDGNVSPIPEPETYALMLAGLAVVGAAARRRKAK